MSRRTRPPHEKTSALYRALWRVVDGAVRDAFDHHPEYLTPRGAVSARRSVNKRVVGGIESFLRRSGEEGDGAGEAVTVSDDARLG